MGRKLGIEFAVHDYDAKGKDVVLTDTAIPEIRPGWVLVKVQAFGLNHSEQILPDGSTFFSIKSTLSKILGLNVPVIPTEIFFSILT